MRTVQVLMRFCHLIDRSFVCKAKEGRHIRIDIFLASTHSYKFLPSNNLG